MNRVAFFKFNQCLPCIRYVALSISLWICSVVASAQEADSEEVLEIQRQLSLFGTLLEDALRLNESSGLFGMSLGGVESIYLTGQGAVLEVRSPLANRRYRLGLASLRSSMQTLQLGSQNPFDLVRRNIGVIEQQTENLRVGSAYRQLLDRIENIDYSLVTQSALQQATQSARALRSLGEVDDVSFAELEQELADLGEAVSLQAQALRKFEQEVRSSHTTGQDVDADWVSRLDELLSNFEPIKQRTMARAAELRQQSEQAERDYAAAWQRDLEEFRLQLFRSVCEYSAGLSALPLQEKLSLVLKGLGDDQVDNRRRDELHILSNDDIQACAIGNIDAGTLRERTIVYSW
ncbi:MAG: hypothetical protein OXD01_11420 [Gammaproteobacteria bacterium]|nr:hypothetical protein [Gammaproteobacteria bacterium]